MRESRRHICEMLCFDGVQGVWEVVGLRGQGRQPAGKCLQKKSESRIGRINGLHGLERAPVSPMCKHGPIKSTFADAGL